MATRLACVHAFLGGLPPVALPLSPSPALHMDAHACSLSFRFGKVESVRLRSLALDLIAKGNRRVKAMLGKVGEGVREWKRGERERRG